ncbi:MAG: PIG-L family deacetylase [Alphaproteobacteria bacterium]|nr:PIG-L family deacetylase [Alphaproteobacteria bacterium]
MSIATKLARRAYRRWDEAVYDRLYGGRKSRITGIGAGRALNDLPTQPALVVAAHPDDETLGAGDLLSRLTDTGIVIVTDGAPKDGVAARAAGFDGNEAYRQARAQETANVLALIGRGDMPVSRLGISDQEAVIHIPRIVSRLIEIMRAKKFRYVVTHPYEGGHPDHDATALAVHAACFLLREDGSEAPLPVEMTSYHLAGGRMIYGGFLPAAGAGPVQTFPLDAARQDRKQCMLQCYRSQSRIVTEFPLDAEHFRAAPAYDFLEPPHPGTLAYETFLWRMDGAGWRRKAGRALSRLGLLAPA